MAVIGHVTRDIINLAVLASHVHHHVQVIHMKRVIVHRHKTVYAQVARNLPTQSFPRLQDAVGLVILAITKVAVIVLLALYVGQDNLKQKVVHQHKIVNVLQDVRRSLVIVCIVGNLMVIVKFGNVK